MPPTLKLIPDNPADVMVLRDVSPNIVTLSVPFNRMGWIPIGGRCTIVKLTSGALAVFSPVALTDDVKAKVESMGGAVKYLIAPDIEHHLFLSQWATAYPDAILVGPEGLPEKRLKASSSDSMIGREPFTVVFEARSKRETRIGGDFDVDFEYEYVDAHPNREIVFYYRPERVLVQADLMFNMPAREQYSRVPEDKRPKEGALVRFFNGLNTPGEAGSEPKGMKRFLWYAISKGGKAAFNESIQIINQWDFDTMIPCHGETIEGNAKEVFRRVFEWHINGRK